jgi:hypothetical protein
VVFVCNQKAKDAACPEQKGDEKHPYLFFCFDILRRFNLYKFGFGLVAHEKYFGDYDCAHKNHVVHSVAPHQIQVPRVLK